MQAGEPWRLECTFAARERFARTEVEAAREVIQATLDRFGVDCRKREIEVSVIGNRVGAAFIFERGTPGSLLFSKGRDSWCADAWP